MTTDIDTREAVELRADLRARIAAHVAPTFRHSGDPDPHPDEDALVERLTDAVLPLEVELRAALGRLKQLEDALGAARLLTHILEGLPHSSNPASAGRVAGLVGTALRHHTELAALDDQDAEALWADDPDSIARARAELAASDRADQSEKDGRD